MLEDIEAIARNYIEPTISDPYDRGFLGIIESEDSRDRWYCEGLYDGQHFHTLLHILKQDGVITCSYRFMIDKQTEKHKKFMLYIIKYMSYYCCLDYLLTADIPKEFKIPIVKRLMDMIVTDKIT